MKKLLVSLLLGLSGISPAFCQDLSKGQLKGNFEIDAQYYNPDSSIGAPAVPEKALMNGWGNVNYVNGKFSAGLRYESYLNVMQGYDARYKGTGIPYRYITYDNDKLEITVGSSYEQFGSGLVLRAYEDRGLLYDNALDGVRVRYNPYKGVYLKGVWGKQRTFFTSTGIVRGFDGELNLNEFFDSCMAKCKTTFIVGGSFVSKYQSDQDPTYVLPENVGVSAGRLNIISPKLNFYAEYAYKINDPSATNEYIYKPGEAAYVSLAYSKKGIGFIASAKRIDNMSYRSDRTASGNAAVINYLPALTRQHTYPLAAYYPYATQPNGEIGWQADFSYKFKKGTALGGHYGTDLSLNYSASYGLDTTVLHDESGRRFGYSSEYFALGRQYYQDINVEIGKKISKKVKGTLLYAFITYDKEIIEGHPGDPVVPAHIAVVDIITRLGENVSLRTDIEHMYATKDRGSWVLGLAELTLAPHWFVAAMDQYNYGNTDSEQRIHFVNGQVGYSRGTNRIAVGYGKQRAGIFCVGGVCRFVPASNGFTLTITSSF